MRNAALPDVDQLITMNIDALALLNHTKCELSMRRRDAIRPNLNNDYSSLCASHVPTYLFGDNLETQLNDICASNKISKAAVPQRFDKARPYGHPHFHSTNNSSSKGKSRKNQPLSTVRRGRDTQQGRPFIQKDLAISRQSPTKTITPNKEVNKQILENLQVNNLEKDLPLLISYLTTQFDRFQAGQLSHKLCEWHKLTSDSEVLCTV